MANFFTQPFNPVEKTKAKFISIFVFGGFIFLFLFIFRPFGLDNVESVFMILLLSAGFGIVTILMLLIFKYLLDPLIIRGRWTLAKNLIYNFMVAASIGVANYLYIILIFGHKFAFLNLLFSIWAAVLVAVIPVTIGYFVTFNTLYRKALKDADIRPSELYQGDELTLTGGYPRNSVKLKSSEIVYICSNDNYITIVSGRGASLEKLTVRGTLKVAEKELSGYGSFIRCHKCYIVNTSFAEGLTGNSRNLSVRMTAGAGLIPVSRSHATAVRRKIRMS